MSSAILHFCRIRRASNVANTLRHKMLDNQQLPT